MNGKQLIIIGVMAMAIAACGYRDGVILLSNLQEIAARQYGLTRDSKLMVAQVTGKGTLSQLDLLLNELETASPDSLRKKVKEIKFLIHLEKQKSFFEKGYRLDALRDRTTILARQLGLEILVMTHVAALGLFLTRETSTGAFLSPALQSA